MSHPVIHFEFGAPDGGALADFYGRLFGWEVRPSGPEYWLLSPGGGGLAGGVLQTSGGTPPYFTVYVSVDDLEASIADAEKLGASRVVEATSVPGVGTFAMIRDPAGNLIGMMVQDTTASDRGGSPS
ncbi:VOC family protein [Leifsonia sp. C5G2]|uniref:VOC family protein n=1 Tax=Leifsonia sp. C5G2 TaxID=2735269 RepID=UPI001584E696|nr:VOC family protein [Leifsonia sp. C5G2]NUU07251.1 VOC family protein [Leifsonia sp. C5G2]